MPKTYTTIEDRQEAHLLAMIAWKRNEADIRQEEAAKTIGITQSHYSRKEKGKRPMTIREFLTLCNAIGIKPSEILKEIGE